MTNEEAINTIKVAISEVEWNYPLDYTIAFKFAISALEKQIPQKPIIKLGELHTTHNYGRLMSFHCPSCGKFIVAMYETDVERGGGIHKDLKGCSTCLQAIDFTEYYHIDKLDEEINWSDEE